MKIKFSPTYNGARNTFEQIDKDVLIVNNEHRITFEESMKSFDCSDLPHVQSAERLIDETTGLLELHVVLDQGYSKEDKPIWEIKDIDGLYRGQYWEDFGIQGAIK